MVIVWAIRQELRHDHRSPGPLAAAYLLSLGYRPAFAFTMCLVAQHVVFSASQRFTDPDGIAGVRFVAGCALHPESGGGVCSHPGRSVVVALYFR